MDKMTRNLGVSFITTFLLISSWYWSLLRTSSHVGHNAFLKYVLSSNMMLCLIAITGISTVQKDCVDVFIIL